MKINKKSTQLKRKGSIMTWLKRNITVGNWLIIGTLATGFFMTSGEKLFSFSTLIANDKKQDIAIELNSDYRKQGHSFGEAEAVKLDKAYLVASDEGLHMPFETKINTFVPRTEYRKTEKRIERIAGKQDEIYLLLVDISGRLQK